MFVMMEYRCYGVFLLLVMSSGLIQGAPRGGNAPPVGSEENPLEYSLLEELDPGRNKRKKNKNDFICHSSDTIDTFCVSVQWP